jgi:hypothetical protein
MFKRLNLQWVAALLVMSAVAVYFTNIAGKKEPIAMQVKLFYTSFGADFRGWQLEVLLSL